MIASALFAIEFADCARGHISNITIERNDTTSEVNIKFIWPKGTNLDENDFKEYLRNFHKHVDLSSLTNGSTTEKHDCTTQSSTPKGHLTSQTISESNNNTHASQDISNTTVDKKSTPIKANTGTISPDTEISSASSAVTKNETSTTFSITDESKTSTASPMAEEIITATKSAVPSNTIMNMSVQTHQVHETSQGARNGSSVMSGIIVTITVVVFLVSGVWIYGKYTSTRFRTTANNYHLLR